MKTVSLDEESFKMTEDISNDLKTGIGGVLITKAGSLTRKAVPPPTMFELLMEVDERGQLMRKKPGGVALCNSADEAREVIQVSVRANKSIWRD